MSFLFWQIMESKGVTKKDKKSTISKLVGLQAIFTKITNGQRS